MENLTRKQIVLQSIKHMHKQRLKTLFRLQALRRQGNTNSDIEQQLIDTLSHINRKISWEMTTNHAALQDNV